MAEQQRAGLTCGEELLTRGVDGARPFLGLHCGAITTGLERHRLSVEHSARGRARGRVVPEPLRPPTNFRAGGLFVKENNNHKTGNVRAIPPI